MRTEPVNSSVPTITTAQLEPTPQFEAQRAYCTVDGEVLVLKARCSTPSVPLRRTGR